MFYDIIIALFNRHIVENKQHTVSFYFFFFYRNLVGDKFFFLLYGEIFLNQFEGKRFLQNPIYLFFFKIITI